MAEEQKQSRLEERVQRALDDHTYVNYQIKPSFEKDTNDYKVRASISDGVVVNGVPRNAVGLPADEAKLWLDRMVEKTEKKAIEVLNSEVYRILQEERLGELYDDERVMYQLSVIANLADKGIKVEGLSNDLENIAGKYVEGVRLKKALDKDDKPTYIKAVRDKLNDEKISALDALYTGTVLGRNDEPAIKHQASEIVRVNIETAIRAYKNLEAKRKKNDELNKPYNELSNAVNEALEKNKENGAYLSAYDAVLNAYAAHKIRAEAAKKAESTAQIEVEAAA